ncbi:Protein N-acetyltransferase, RimJ/RimL family [Halobacillus alkaliphilus]|uniref:Protein N-acetyltransferase, RimJ/RimL family n=1 Tax=Halobacillus alkaliphilus TaxID=396056 RepID=A0A1I2QU22_9BACI|nr:GNAT family N-acetyltransferase [Halobacillus alkaliphilus]SFG31818.1 Protein N-acetyltransferase, RimJ/RimL family [Halobacillus alkaliphilus]
MNFETQRLKFRKYNDDDFDYLFSLLSDPEMVRYIGDGNTKDAKSTTDFLKWIYSTYDDGPDRGLMVLENKEDNTRIGHAGLVPQTVNGVDVLEIGYWISRKHWGKGYATEAAKALKNYGLIDLGEDRLVSLIQPNNMASKMVAIKIGMGFDKEIVLGNQKVHIHST